MIGALLPTLCAASTRTLEAEFRYSADRLKVQKKEGGAIVSFAGGSASFVPGQPDLPLVSERVELPPGTRVTAVEILRIEGETLEGTAYVPPSYPALLGRSAPTRSSPDPAAYARSGFQPDTPVEIGYQGLQRGHDVAFLIVRPVRWDPSTRKLERVKSVRVRLRLDDASFPDAAPRERIVREWEDSAIPPARLGTSSVTSAARVTTATIPGPTAQPFRPTQLPSVLGSPVAYVIVTNDALASEFQRLADWKTQSGVPTVVRTVSFIQQQYPSGADDADKIRQFIRDAYTRWGTKWVLLGGDTDVIPERLVYSTFNAPAGSNTDIACDLYYSCLDGNWDADGDSYYGEAPEFSGAPNNDQVDLLPEVYVGRAPVSTLAQTTQFIDKVFQYSRTPVGDYETRHLYFAEVIDPQNWSPGQTDYFDGAETIEQFLPHIRVNPALKYGRLYENYSDPRWEPGALLETRARVLDSLNAGYNVAVHCGHGFRNVMSVGDANLTNADVSGLQNGNRLTNLYASNCTSNAIDFPCIGEAFMRASNGGGVSVIGATRLDYPSTARAFQEEYFKLVFQDSVSAVGEAQARQKLPFVANSVYEGVNRWTELALLLLGDPEMRIWTGTPRTLSVTRPASIAANATGFSVNVKIGAQPLYGARVTAYKPNDDYRSVTTDGAGNATLDFRPDSVGSFTLTVTAYDCRPFQVTIPITAASGPLLVEQAMVVDDDAVGGTNGNGNQIIEAGETVDIRIPVRNNGSSAAGSVTATLATSDPLVTILTPSNSYGTIGATAVASGSGWFRLSTPFTATDQREIPLTLTIHDNLGRVFTEPLTVTLRAPELRHLDHTIVETVGNGNGRPEAGETVQYFVKLRNLGTGQADGVTAVLRNYDGMASITDSTASFGTIAPGAEVQGDAFVFSVTNGAAKLELRVSTSFGLALVQTLDLTYLGTPLGLALKGSNGSITLTWTPNQGQDLLGYYIYRSGPGGGALSRVNPVPAPATSYYLDSGLQPLTRYDYAIATVDNSGNVSAQTAVVSASTNPPYHTVYPISMAQNTSGSITVAHIYNPGQMDIIAGADVLYCWHADGTAPVDADQSSVTSGDFTTQGTNFTAGASVADIDGGSLEIVAPTWDTQRVYVFDTQGQVKSGWPFTANSAIWSTVAIGDLDGDGKKELVFGSNGTNLYALRSNGTEWMDGDANAATPGVFKVLGASYNMSTPALAPLESSSTQLDIVYGDGAGFLNAWRPNGTNLTGFPIFLGGQITASPAIGYLDGASDTQFEIVVASGNGDDSLYVFEPTGARRPGFPVYLRGGGTSKQPSPALADVNNDGFLDIVVASTNGQIYVYDRNGALLPAFANVRYSTLTDGASESSPVVADISGDGIPDIVMGDENGVLSGFSGTGAVLPGFPIVLDSEVRGTPALCDCDGDGKSEIVVTSWGGKVYVWDYDFNFSPGVSPPWPQFHHDAMRTGVALASRLVDTLPGPPPLSVELAAPAPNPARARTRIDYGVPQDASGAGLEIAVFDVSGRRVKTLVSRAATPGRFSSEWNLRTEAGERATAGIYFVRMRLGSERRTSRFIVLP